MAKMQLAPDRLWQAINPWNFYFDGAQFGTINVNIGATEHPAVESALLDEVGSYGRQLGRIGDALEVLIEHVDRTTLNQAEKDALAVALGQFAEVRKVKARALATDG